VAIRVKVERLAFFDSLEMLFLTFSYGIFLLGEFAANGKQSLSQPVVLSEVLAGNFICFSVNLPEIK
jgi:hypothetical protein